MHRNILACLLTLSCLPTLAGSEKALRAVLETEHFEIWARPGSRAAAAAERDAAMAERGFADLCAKLEFTPGGRFTLHLYDDVPELQLITGVKGAGAFSAGRDVHVAQGDDQSRRHEIAHVIAVRLPETGKEARNMFFPDGLANALLEYVHGVHVHAVAKFYRERKRLPALREVAEGDFYAWLAEHPGFNGYDVAGSFFRFLLDTYGAANVKRYYKGTPAKVAFGVDLGRIERAWHETLDGYVLRPEVETLLDQRDGGAGRFTRFESDPGKRIPAELLGRKRDWKPLAGAKLRPVGEGATWKRDGDTIAGSGKGGWHVAEVGTKRYRNCIVRARILTKDIWGGVQLRLGEDCIAMLVGNGTCVWRGGGVVAMSPQEKVRPGGEVDLMMVRRNGTMQVWVDGIKLVEGPVDTAPHRVGIGFHAGPKEGSARFVDLRVRVLK